ncbi:MAG: DivIVA domain-containing protein [Gemmatimonadetes bacterium]|nr:DivIVA domain-containing protein [Gemmatimonadota bacterium]
MSNDGFHLTPIDVRAQEFHRAFRGYHPGDVDEFRQRVAEELERLLKERAELEQRLEGLQEQVEGFRRREKALNDALVLAQQLRAESEQAARRDAEATAREARMQADAVLAEARVEERAMRKEIEAAQRHLSSYLSSFRTLLERYLSEVEAMEAHERDGGASESK